MSSPSQKLMRRALYLGWRALHAGKQWAYSQPRMASLVSDLRNVREFSGSLIHEKMLADRMRVDAYFHAITKHVHEGNVVVDLGTGTGLLSFFAASKAATVHAIEHSQTIEVARALAEANGLRNIEFWNCNSRDFELREPADVLVHEQIGSAIFDENMIENVVDLRDRVLKRGGRILPNRFEVFLEPVQIKDSFRVPFVHEQTIHGVSFAALNAHGTAASGVAGSWPVERWRSIRMYEVEKLLCAPKAVIAFDLETISSPYVPDRIVYDNLTTVAGRIDGLLLYFTASFDDEYVIDTGLNNGETNWSPTLFRLEADHVTQSTPVSYDLTIDDVRTYRQWQIDWRRPRAAQGSSAGVPSG
jgi:protein arginine N-methyltransferase 1